MSTRKHVSLKIKLEVALRQLGLDPSNVRLDHTPPLALRERTADGGYIPDELDPAHMQWLSTEDHARKTSGAAEGEGKATVADSDQHKIAKVDRLTGKVGQNKPKRAWPKNRRLQSRGFQKKPRAQTTDQEQGE